MERSTEQAAVKAVKTAAIGTSKATPAAILGLDIYISWLFTASVLTPVPEGVTVDVAGAAISGC
jgi:hypothetical protein